MEPNAIVESHWTDHRQWLSHGSLARDSVCFLNESAQPNIMCTMTKKSCRNTRQATSFRSPHLLARVNGVLISNWIYHSHTRARGVKILQFSDMPRVRCQQSCVGRLSCCVTSECTRLVCAYLKRPYTPFPTFRFYLSVLLLLLLLVAGTRCLLSFLSSVVPSSRKH